MEDPIQAKIKEFTWDPKKIKSADPKDLLQLIINFRDFTKERINDLRFKGGDIKEYQEISLNWGEWSHNTNKAIRARIKEHDLFPDSAEQRHFAKQLNLVFMFWWKATAYIEAVNAPITLQNAPNILKALTAMDEVKDYFDKCKIEEQEMPEWVK